MLDVLTTLRVQRAGDRFFIREKLIQRAYRGVRTLGDFAHCGGLVAPLSQNFRSGVEQSGDAFLSASLLRKPSRRNIRMRGHAHIREVRVPSCCKFYRLEARFCRADIWEAGVRYTQNVSVTLEWRNWQTHRTQNPAFFTERVGSTPTSSTKTPVLLSAAKSLATARKVQSMELRRC